MGNAKKPYPAAILTYEDALRPVSEDLYQMMLYEDSSMSLSEHGDDRLAEDLQRLADVHTLKAEVLADFVARLFGIEADEAIGDASERAKATYDERRKNG